MKRLFAVTMVVLILMAGFCLAEDYVPASGSALIVSDETDRAVTENGQNATVHTDVYLFVDPDKATYVTFKIMDDDGKPIPGASIFITYKDEEQLYGVSDDKGEASMYLFRGGVYVYRIQKSGFETVTGNFVPTTALKKVNVVLPRYRAVTLAALRNGEPYANAVMYLNGKRVFADGEGRAVLRLTNGVYQLELATERGRNISRFITVDGDGYFEIESIEDDLLVEGGAYSDRFLVYSDSYIEQDYTLTEYRYSAEDVERLPEETDEEYAERVAQYLESHPSVVLVKAMPAENGYEPRIMIPSGWLQRAWEKEGYSQVLFTDGVQGVRFDLADLRNPEMTKAFAVLGVMTGNVTEDIALDENSTRLSGLDSLMEKDEVRLTAENLSGVKDYVFASDRNDEEYVLPDALFDNAWFEYRLTPIEDEALWDAVNSGEEEETEILLSNAEYFRKTFSRWQQEGRISEKTLNQLLTTLADQMLSPDEALEVRKALREDKLAEDQIRQLFSGMVGGSMYRLSCWICSGNVEIEVTDLIKSLRVFWDLDALAEVEEIIAAPEKYRGIFIRENEKDQKLESVVISDISEEGDDFYSVTSARDYRKLTIHIRTVPDENTGSNADAMEEFIPFMPYRVIEGYAPFAGVNALIRVENIPTASTANP